VQSGQFGACLMATPDVVADCVRAMRSITDVPVTVKTRIGIDDLDDYEFLRRFVDANVDAGCGTFIVHARKAILQGLSPKENRTIPPLDYARVHRLKQDYPELCIVLNGGVTSVDECHAHLSEVDGVMIGRQAYHDPWFLTRLESAFGNSNEVRTRRQIVENMLPYIDRQLSAGVPLKHITRHILGLFAEQPGARAWRRYLSENAHKKEADIDVLLTALEQVPLAA